MSDSPSTGRGGGERGGVKCKGKEIQINVPHVYAGSDP